MRGWLATATALFSGQAMAQEPEAVLRALLTEPPLAEQFTSEFLAAVPMRQIRSVLSSLTDEIGPVLSVEEVADTTYRVETETHGVEMRLVLNAEGRVSGLIFQPPERLGVSLDEALSGLTDLPGDLAYRIERDGALLFEAGDDAPVQVGSAFKLGVLAALGDRDLSEVVVLEDRHKSHPTGILQDLPSPAPITLYTAAATMIAESDNTATDLLMEVVGPDRVADILGVDRVLTTRQFFTIKADADLRALYQSDPEAALIEANSRALPPISALSQITHREGLGWAIPLSSLCSVIADVADHPVFQMNPGSVTTSDWDRVAFKGGSEPGVIALVYHLTDPSGRTYCAAMSLADDAEIDTVRATTSFRAVLTALARME